MLLTTSGPVISPWLRDQSWSQPTNQEACSPIPGLWLVDCIHRWKAWCFSNHGSLTLCHTPLLLPAAQVQVEKLSSGSCSGTLVATIIRGICNIDHETLDCRPGHARPPHECSHSALLKYSWPSSESYSPCLGYSQIKMINDWRCGISKMSP